MRIGYIQFSPILGDLAANRKLVRERVQAAPPADLLVLPELCNSGYRFPDPAAARACAEDAHTGEFTRLLRELAASRGTSLVSGLCERDGDRTYNSAVLVTPQGEVHPYRKAHLFLDEKDLFLPGDLGIPVFDVGEVRIGILICFDWQFPEAWRVLSLQGADIVCHPSNLVLPGLAQRAVPIHALLNRVYVVTANRIGTEHDLTFTGLSLVVSPRGEVLQSAAADREETAVVEIDPRRARDKSVTARNDLLADRRPELYGVITSDGRGPEPA
ncbi:MAG: nitrilase-related carbon-nitrogen hydrolase [Candidatus Eisenbacteria bacterium]|uniref:Carbon-nitrogen hydrolase n=1 Tax=Eiseniibacteriota bacterium TaxID=2212470 RepID=A0A956RP38_UNCEI|nr:carbon-nitrogen hydrolase [Candidatus Eisenbacteria bacterium]